EAVDFLNTGHLKMNSAAVRPIELCQYDILPCAKLQLPVDYRNGDVETSKHSAKMRVRIAPITVGKHRIIMLVIDVARNQILKHRFDIREKCSLSLIDHNAS